MSTEQAIMQQEVSCRIANAVLKYAQTCGINLNLLVAGLPFPYTKEYLSNPVNWVNAEISELICQRAAEITGDKAIMAKVGMAVAQTMPLGGLETAVRRLAGPSTLYRLLPTYTRLFNAMFKIKTVITGKNTAFVEISGDVLSGAPTEHTCYFTQGILAVIPVFWNLPAAEVRKIRCIHSSENPDTSNTVPQACAFEVQWQPIPSWIRRFSDNTLGKMIPTGEIFNKLDQNLKNSNRKNAELAEKNRQLAVIREIAINMDKVRTIDEAMTLTVEQARGIPGIRMVLVQKMDEAGENIITPYYSKLRPDTQKMVNAIKLLGFDLEKAMGSPDSELLRFPVAESSVAQDYNKNPRVMVFNSLAELLDGMWPQVVCDGIQKIVGIKKCVIVPLKIEGFSWGHMLFILNKEIATEILEMIAGHCSQAIKNNIYLDNLERKNAELSALNRIAAITSRSLNMKTLLNDSLKEIMQTFTADSAAIYLTKGPGQRLKLVAQHGIANELLEDLEYIALDNVPMGSFFTSRENSMTGPFLDLTDYYPQHKELLLKQMPRHYVTSVLRFGGIRYGLITVVRNNIKTFSDIDRSLLFSISTQLALSLENSRLHDEEVRRADEAEAAQSHLEELFQEHTIMEEKLRESEERYRNIFESANDILILFDNQGKIVEVNARIEDIGGYKRDELVGKDFRVLGKVMTKESLDTLAANYKKRLAGINVPYYDVEMITSQGKHHIIQISAVALHKDGKIIGDLAILRDVTEIKQAEKNLINQKNLIDSVLATIPNAVLLLDKNNKVVMANHSFYNLFNVDKQFVEKNEVCDIPNFPWLRTTIEDAFKNKKDKTSTEVRYSTGSAEKILAINIFPMKEENLLAVISDLTEERAQQERLYLTDRLASVGEMASGVAHELNNPLTSVIGLSGLLMKLDMPEDAKEDLASINSEARRCAVIVKDLLTFARKHTLKKEPVQVTNVVNDVLKLRSYEHRVNNISVETCFPENMPNVLADYYQMQQVFLNIIINAEAAMIDANGHGNLKIGAETKNGHVNIIFTDDGPGIPKENLGLIFNPFFTTKAVGKGTGLGLSIVYGIVTSHNGKVYARSESGHGSTFIVELPVTDQRRGDWQ